MTTVRWLLLLAVIAGLAGCTSDDGDGGAQPAFRNLGKRAASDVGVERASVPVAAVK